MQLSSGSSVPIDWTAFIVDPQPPTDQSEPDCTQSSRQNCGDWLICTRRIRVDRADQYRQLKKDVRVKELGFLRLTNIATQPYLFNQAKLNSLFVVERTNSKFASSRLVTSSCFRPAQAFTKFVSAPDFCTARFPCPENGFDAGSTAHLDL